MFRPSTTLGATVALLACLASSPTARADQSAELRHWIADHGKARKYTPAEAMNRMPPGPNPYTSFLPEGKKANQQFWDARMAGLAAVKAASMPPANVRLQAKKFRGTVVRAFGTNPNQADEIDLLGTVELAPAIPLAQNPEDEGSIPLATPTNLTSGSTVRSAGTIGDGPFGSAGTGSGDFDFFEIPGVQAGDVLVIDVDTPDPFGPLDPFIVLWDADGNVIAFNDDDGFSFDSFLGLIAPFDGTLYVSVAGFFSFAPNDPFDSSSGNGAGSEGDYEISIGLNNLQVDTFSVNLRKGDILGVSQVGPPAALEIIDKPGDVRLGSTQDLTFIHPEASPLPSGFVSASHTVESTGYHQIRVTSVASGDYQLSLRAFKAPLLSGDRGDVQTIFIDFDGATVDVGAYFGFPGFFFADLSPLVDFLPGWGLTAADEDDVIDAIMATVEAVLVEEVDKAGREPTFDIRLLNSRDDADPGDDPLVSRIVVGGSIPEFGIPTIGIAESIDVGNFETAENAVVLLDLLSAPASNPNSLNQYGLAPGVSIIDLIGVGVGNITAHEAGHFLGNFHTDQFNDNPNIQDQGGNLSNTVGVGPDGIFGTDDDELVSFGRDVFVPNEGLTGIEDTLNRVSIGNPTPRGNGR
jgi:hypothetical protein